MARINTWLARKAFCLSTKTDADVPKNDEATQNCFENISPKIDQKESETEGERKRKIWKQIYIELKRKKVIRLFNGTKKSMGFPFSRSNGTLFHWQIRLFSGSKLTQQTPTHRSRVINLPMTQNAPSIRVSWLSQKLTRFDWRHREWGLTKQGDRLRFSFVKQGKLTNKMKTFWFLFT